MQELKDNLDASALRDRKEHLSATHNLSLEQIEWAYALYITLQGFESLTLDRQHIILQTLCGINETHRYSFSTLSELWDCASTLSTEATGWLLEGLSQPETIEAFFSCLERFQIEDLELSRIESLREVEQEDNNIEEHNVPKDPDDIATNYDSWVPKDTTVGHLLIRIQDPLRGSYHYCTFNGSINRTFPNLSYEQDLLAQWKRQTHTEDIPLAMLCLTWTASKSSGTKDAILSKETSAAIKVQSLPHPFHHSVSHEAILQCSGRNEIKIKSSGINLQAQTIQSDSQHLEHWTTELFIVRGDNTPMYWNLNHQVIQSLKGEGFRGGFVSLRSNVHIQIVDKQNQYLLGTNSNHPPVLASLLNEQTCGNRKSSRINNWLSDPPIDFSKHVVSNTAKTEPIFNNTPSLAQRHELTSNHTGSGTKLLGMFFAEIHTKAWQENTRQRVALSYTNSIVSTVSGTLFWNQNYIDLLKDGTLRWTWQDESLNIRCLWSQEQQITTQTERSTSNEGSEKTSIQHTQFTREYSRLAIQ